MYDHRNTEHVYWTWRSREAHRSTGWTTQTNSIFLIIVSFLVHSTTTFNLSTSNRTTKYDVISNIILVFVWLLIEKLICFNYQDIYCACV